MTPALTLTLGLLAGAPGDCYLVTHTQILALPTCDIGPATIDALTEDPGPSQPALRRPTVAPGRSRVARAAVAPVVARQTALERRLEAAEQRRVAAVARRLAAERERDEALRERDEALRELAAARRALAAARGGGDVRAADRSAPP